MAQTEDRAAAGLAARGVEVERDVESRRLRNANTGEPIAQWPWKSPSSRKAPTGDLYLPAARLVVEVKGWMTIHAMAKLAWCMQQTQFAYYVLQMTEPDWDPMAVPLEPGISGARDRVEYQLDELAWVARNPARAMECNRVCRERLRRYIELRVREFRAWAGEWP